MFTARRRRLKRRHAFTLMEVLLVLVILVILGSMAGVFIRGAQKKARADAARSQIGAFENAIKMYELNVMSYPPTLEALRQPPGDIPNWSGPYLDREVPLDPWGNPYQYQLVDSETYRIWSMGSDGLDGSADDISNEF
jgi:general secretion pathway protein G